MNRIILIGNGFDLAHGMKTSYRQFIDDYWDKCIKETLKLGVNIKYENDEIIIESRPMVQIPTDSYKEFSKELKKHRKPIFFKNKFFQIISDNSHLQNWVDIENEYYYLLKRTFNNISSSPYGVDVRTLNLDFASVKNKLIEYLKNVETNFNENLDSNFLRTKNIIGHKIYHPFKLKDFSESSLNQKAEIEYNLIKKDLEALAD